MPRFVILEHDHPSLHWDLMLESGEVLRTWRLTRPPEPGRAVSATATFDHRRVYLDYEGPISGNRGQVSRWDYGTFSWRESEEDRLELELTGMRLRGVLSMRRSTDPEWVLTVTAT